MYHSFLIHSSSKGHLGCVHVLAIVISDTTNLCLFQFWFHWGTYPIWDGCVVGGNANWYNHYGEQYGDSLKCWSKIPITTWEAWVTLRSPCEQSEHGEERPSWLQRPVPPPLPPPHHSADHAGCFVFGEGRPSGFHNASQSKERITLSMCKPSRAGVWKSEWEFRLLLVQAKITVLPFRLPVSRGGNSVLFISVCPRDPNK